MMALVLLSRLLWPLPICGIMGRSITTFPPTTAKSTQISAPLRNGATSLKLSGMDPPALAVLQSYALMARSSTAFKLGSLSATIILLVCTLRMILSSVADNLQATWVANMVPMSWNPLATRPSQFELTSSFRIRGVHLFSTHERRCG